MMLPQGPEVSSAWTTLDAVIDRGRQLPDLVFRSHFAQFCWLEFEDVLDDPFFACLQALRTEHSEQRILAACVEPDPIANFGHSGLASFDADQSVTDYDAFMGTGHIDALINIRNIGNVIVYCGDSLSWAFVADRSAEVAVGAATTPGRWPVIKGVRYHTFDSMLDIAAGPFRGALPPRVREAYERNFRAQSWPLDTYVEG